MDTYKLWNIHANIYLILAWDNQYNSSPKKLEKFLILSSRNY